MKTTFTLILATVLSLLIGVSIAYADPSPNAGSFPVYDLSCTDGSYFPIMNETQMFLPWFDPNSTIVANPTRVERLFGDTWVLLGEAPGKGFKTTFCTWQRIIDGEIVHFRGDVQFYPPQQ